jgi:outer membrane protein assembly factor BamD (BamD/ComL family)
LSSSSLSPLPALSAPPPAAAPPPPAASDTAASLFAKANALRRQGDVRRAISLYETLEDRFGASPEAAQSEISVGTLELALNDPARALGAFDSYVGHTPAGPLAEEALFGRARSLRMLGRTADERQTWQSLVTRYPGSTYEPMARSRLRELTR